MKIIRHELKEAREKNISNHLAELNKDNHTLAIDLNELDVRIFSTTKNHCGIIYLQKGNIIGGNQNDAGLHGEFWIRYRCKGEEYRLIFNAYDSFGIKNMDNDGNLIKDLIDSPSIINSNRR